MEENYKLQMLRRHFSTKERKIIFIFRNVVGIVFYFNFIFLQGFDSLENPLGTSFINTIYKAVLLKVK